MHFVYDTSVLSECEGRAAGILTDKIKFIRAVGFFIYTKVFTLVFVQPSFL